MIAAILAGCCIGLAWALFVATGAGHRKARECVSLRGLLDASERLRQRAEERANVRVQSITRTARRLSDALAERNAQLHEANLRLDSYRSALDFTSDGLAALRERLH